MHPAYLHVEIRVISVDRNGIGINTEGVNAVKNKSQNKIQDASDYV